MSSTDATFDADRILGGKRPGQGALYQGSIAAAWAARGKGFDVLVLCAEEAQADEDDVRQMAPMRVIQHPFDDCKLTADHLAKAVTVAREVAYHVARGKKVLVTCFAGWNRSGLVTALACHMLTGFDGPTILGRVQTKRKGALRNESFARAVLNLRGTRVHRPKPNQMVYGTFR